MNHHTSLCLIVTFLCSWISLPAQQTNPEEKRRIEQESSEEDMWKKEDKWKRKKILEIHNTLSNYKGNLTLTFQQSISFLLPKEDESHHEKTLTITLSNGKYAFVIVTKGEEISEKFYFDGQDLYYHDAISNSLQVGSIERLLDNEYNKSVSKLDSYIALPYFKLHRDYYDFLERTGRIKVVESDEKNIRFTNVRSERTKVKWGELLNFGTLKIYKTHTFESYDKNNNLSYIGITKLTSSSKEVGIKTFKISAAGIDHIYDYDLTEPLE